MPAASISKTTRYVHFDLGKDIPTGIAGYYTPEREVRLLYNGREVLYIVGKAVLEASCCGVGKWAYVAVPGYLVRWHTSQEEGRFISETEPITDPQEREQLRKIIEDKESAELIQFD